MAQVPSVRQQRTLWQQTQRMGRRYREVIMIVLTLIMSLAFLAVGFYIAISLESQHPLWFGHGY